MSQIRNKCLRISIEGNIASGKSSIVDYLVKQCNLSGLDFLSNHQLRLFKEPVDLWRDLNGVNLLQLMYEDPKRWAFAFHSYVQLTILENHLRMNEVDENNNGKNGFYPISIMERSIFSSRYCFLENIYKSDLLTKFEYEILDKWFNFMTEKHDCELDVIFYLRTKPETCMQRVYERARAEEASSITLDYLRNLHEHHEQWLVRSDYFDQSEDSLKFHKKPLVIIVNADKSFDDVCKLIEAETRNLVSMKN